MEYRVVRATKIGLNWYDALHVLFGFLAVSLRREWLFTIIFLFKQLVDFLGGENPAECGGDVAEYSVGLVLGLIFKNMLAL